MEGKQKSNTVV